MFDDFGVLIRGIVLGLAIAAPVGPIGLLCIRRTVERGIIAGLATGFGSALADGFFGGVAAFGVNAILEALLGHVKELRLIGGIFLLGAAIHSLLKEPHERKNRPPDAGNLIGSVGTGLFLTVTNPITIMGIITVVVGFGGALDHAKAGTMTLGVFLGSLTWWSILCGGTFLIRHHFTPRIVLWINRGTGVVLGVVGLMALLSFFSLVPENLQDLVGAFISK
ncbi:LysE/ArgO family amino acid transporter [Nitrospirillum sp. BR 11163]|uniref:LysE/ArgO family amino acid transporter n=1 Tax=Nitrospirillum sp. BR 11163 TaxID=3104323 RepID=UPI002AFEBC8D|nr:LysE family transporter [Nitrospirillum sp. BR 11163]MEA1677171.1 LysE family transporter [Nitrospirillum sp. BR 11163]